MENDNTVYEYFYPAWPPSQVNATSAFSKTTMWTGETFWVNGTSNYWNSTSYPNDFSKLLPADECPVTVKLNGVTYATGKTDLDGNYSLQVTAPTAPGPYTVNVTVSNATANRNVPCKSAEQQITVNAHALALTLGLNKTVSIPGEQRWANGTVSLDGSPAGAGLQVNLSVNGTATAWNVTTNAGGGYSSQFTAPATGNYTVSATVWHPTHGIRAWKETILTVTETPVADLEVTADGIIRTGTLMEGVNQRFNITVFNKGNAVATDAVINVTMDGALLNSSVRTIPDGANVTFSLNWTATPGAHNLTVFADPQNLIAESGDSNNNASNTFTVTARTIAITLGMSTVDIPPGEPVWANGTVTMDGAPATAGVEVNVSIDGTDEYWLVDTDAHGNYSAEFDAPDAEGDYTVNASVTYPGYPAITAWDTDDFTVAIPPFADLVVLNSNITVIGSLVNGTEHYINVAVRNTGTLATTNVQVNITMDGILLSSTRQNIGAGAQRVINFTWTAAVGNRNITAVVDPADEIAEASEDNNRAWKTFTVAASEIPIDLDTDDDGYPDADDAFPNDPDEWLDTDGDGIGNNADTDDDDDGVPDEDDLDPLDPEVGAEEGGGGNTLLIAVVIIIILGIVGLLVFKFVIMKPKP